MSLESVNPWYRRITYTFGSNWTIFQNWIWPWFLLWFLWQGKGCIDQVSNGPGDCESLMQDYFYPTADLIFKVEMDQKEDHFHVVLLTTPFSYTTDVSDGWPDGGWTSTAPGPVKPGTLATVFEYWIENKLHLKSIRWSLRWSKSF